MAFLITTMTRQLQSQTLVCGMTTIGILSTPLTRRPVFLLVIRLGQIVIGIGIFCGRAMP